MGMVTMVRRVKTEEGEHYLNDVLALQLVN